MYIYIYIHKKKRTEFGEPLPFVFIRRKPVNKGRVCLCYVVMAMSRP